MSTSYYDILGVPRTATEGEIKKAYKKLAMKYHPDKNAGDKASEAKFKQLNEAYQTLGDTQKKKNYDQFGSADAGGYSGGGSTYGSRGHTQGFDMGDIFSQFGGMWGGSSSKDFDMGDIFGGGGTRSRAHTQEKKEPKEIVNLDVVRTVEIPFFDFLYDTTIDVETVYAKHLTLKIKAGTKPGTKYKISGKWRASDGKTGDMYVVVDAKMPQIPMPQQVQAMVDALRYMV